MPLVERVYDNSDTFTVPPLMQDGLWFISFECWGGGAGGGASDNANNIQGVGGGGGAYGYGFMANVRAGDVFTIGVGSAGAATAGTHGEEGQWGGDTIVTRGATYICGAGGGHGRLGSTAGIALGYETVKRAGGDGAACTAGRGSGGGGGSGANGGAGGNGADSATTATGGAGGTGGAVGDTGKPAASGGMGASDAAAAQAGLIPGGGGGGAITTAAGAVGGKGRVILRFWAGVSVATVTFATPGGFSWRVPPNVGFVQITCVGGGGAGASNSGTHTGGGGGGGAYSLIDGVAVTAGSLITGFVGAAGKVGGASASASTAVVAGVTVCSADYGGPGTGAGAGGTGGLIAAGIGSSKASGGDGGVSGADYGGGGGAGAAVGNGPNAAANIGGQTAWNVDARRRANGADSQQAVSNQAQAGVSYGGGGGGGADKIDCLTGADGTTGVVIITYTIENPTPLGPGGATRPGSLPRPNGRGGR